MQRALIKEYSHDDKQWDAGELPEVQAWQKRWPAGDLLRVVTLPQVVTTKRLDTIPATHGSFDNSIVAIGETLERIRGKKLAAPLEWLDY
jgi:hypothetical protein